MSEKSISDQFTGLFEQIKAYVSLRADYLKVQVAEYLIRFFSSLVLWIVMFWILFFVLVFGSFAFAYWFGEMTGRWSLGFLIIAAFYVLVAIFIYSFRRALILRPFTRMVLSQLELDPQNNPENEK